MQANIRLYPWFKFFQSLLFWQAIWFLFFQQRLSGAEAILLYAVYDISTTVLEVPSGYMSDRIGRRITLILSILASLAGMLILGLGDGFWVFVLAQLCLGAGSAFLSGTDSSLLYESLAAEGRAAEVEALELRAWRFGFTGLALSAVIGGVMAGHSQSLPFLASAATAGAALVFCLGFREPPHGHENRAEAHSTLVLVREALTRPVLAWCFVLALSMYAFSHVPFVFGQPFILEALDARGLAAEAPAVSGAVTAAMMLVSVGTSWLVPGLRRALGVSGILLAALAMQVWLIGMLAWSNHVLVIALLLLRMVPDSMAKPVLLARIQPLLADRGRATYLSLQSFCGRLLLAGSLVVISSGTGGEDAMAYAEIRWALAWYVGAGLAVLAGLALSVRALGRHG